MSNNHSKSYGRGGSISRRQDRNDPDSTLQNVNDCDFASSPEDFDGYGQISSDKQSKKQRNKNGDNKNGGDNNHNNQDQQGSDHTLNPDPDFYKSSNPRAGNQNSAIKSTIQLPTRLPRAILTPNDSNQSSNHDDKPHNHPGKSRKNKNEGCKEDKKSSSSKKHFDFNHINPFDILNECMVCSHPIKVYAGSSCGHTDDLCGECLFKLRLFAKQTSSNITLNPITGEEETHRATVVIKSEYITHCELITTSKGKDEKIAKINSLQSLVNNAISDPSLDVDFIAQCRSRDVVCLFCHVPITPLLLSKTPIKPSTYQLLTLLHLLQSCPKQSQKYHDTQSQIYNLLNITYQQATLNKKSFSTFIETNFLYNANLDLYTLPQDGTDFFETVENIAAITCQKCVSNNDDQHHYTNARSLTTEINADFSVTYQTTPLIVPPKSNITLSPILSNIAIPSQSILQPDAVSIQVGHEHVFDLIPKDDYHEQTITTKCSITSPPYHHQSFSSLRQLNHHTSHCHGLEICTACYSVSHDFIHERSLFNHKDILLHGKKNQHSFCSLCRHQCYDNDELYAHLIDPANKHYMCRLCTTDNTVHQNELSQSGPIQAKKQSFKFFRNKAAYVLHLHHDHFVCDHPQCKQYDPMDTKNLNMSDPNRVHSPHKMVVFSTQFDLQQHQTNAHQSKSKSGSAAKKVDLTAMFTNTSNRIPSITSTSSIQPGYARTGISTSVAGVNFPTIKDESGKIIKTTLDIDDIFVFSRIVQLSSDTQTALALLQSNELLPSLSLAGGVNHNDTNTTTTSGVQLVDNTAPNGNKPNLNDRQQYKELFPTLRGSDSSSHKSNAFPSLGAGKHSSQTNQNHTQKPQQAFPAFGSTKPTSGGVPPAVTIVAAKCTHTPTTIVASPHPTPPTHLQPKKNNLQDFINWNRVNASSHTLLPTKSTSKTKTSTHRYYDYNNPDDDGDIYNSGGYAYDAIGTSKQSFTSALGMNTALSSLKSIENDRKNLVGDRKIDFPQMLGPAVVSPPRKLPVLDKKAKKNKSKPGVITAPLISAWGTMPTPLHKPQQTQAQSPPPSQQQQQQKRAKVQELTRANQVPTDTKATNGSNTGLVLTTPILNIQTSFTTTDRNNYEELLKKYIEIDCVEIGKQVTNIIGNPLNKGSKAPLIDQLLFTPASPTNGSKSNDAKDDNSTLARTRFEKICDHVRGLDMPKNLPSFNSILLLQTLVSSTLSPVLSSAQKKSLSLLTQQLSIIVQGLLSEDGSINLENFNRSTKIMPLVPTGASWKLITASMQTLNQKYSTSSHAMPVILQYPGLDQMGIIGDKNRAELCSILQNPSTTPATLNKTLVPLVNDAMSLTRRTLLYTYLQAYLKFYLFKPINFQKLINSYLRSLDAQETM